LACLFSNGGSWTQVLLHWFSSEMSLKDGCGPMSQHIVSWWCRTAAMFMS